MIVLGFDRSSQDQAVVARSLARPSSTTFVEAGAVDCHVLRSVLDAADDLLFPVILGSQH